VLKPPLLRIFNFRIAKRLVLIGGLSTLIGVFAWAHATVAASETIDPNVKNNENEKIRILADKLFAEVDAGVIEFVGNVKATHAETVISADRLKIIYNPDTIKSQTNALKPVSINKIIAKGSKVTREGHSITGTKFTLQRSDGKITVESSEKNRVKAVFHPSEKDK
jgi:lipopolysaccharide export system protein LptA